jgi:hypothetical protein
LPNLAETKDARDFRLAEGRESLIPAPGNAARILRQVRLFFIRHAQTRPLNRSFPTRDVCHEFACLFWRASDRGPTN